MSGDIYWHGFHNYTGIILASRTNSVSIRYLKKPHCPGGYAVFSLKKKKYCAKVVT